MRDMGEGEDCCRRGADCIQDCNFKNVAAYARFEATQRSQQSYFWFTPGWVNAEDPE